MPIDQLVDIGIGDLVLLIGKYETQDYETAGFVVAMNNRVKGSSVKLSHNNPNKGNMWRYHEARKRISLPGNRWYNLEMFDSYEVLRKAKNKEENEEDFY
jgi:hypothetical protein